MEIKSARAASSDGRTTTRTLRKKFTNFLSKHQKIKSDLISSLSLLEWKSVLYQTLNNTHSMIITVFHFSISNGFLFYPNACSHSLSIRKNDTFLKRTNIICDLFDIWIEFAKRERCDKQTKWLKFICKIMVRVITNRRFVQFDFTFASVKKFPISWICSYVWVRVILVL